MDQRLKDYITHTKKKKKKKKHFSAQTDPSLLIFSSGPVLSRTLFFPFRVPDAPPHHWTLIFSTLIFCSVGLMLPYCSHTGLKVWVPFQISQHLRKHACGVWTSVKCVCGLGGQSIAWIYDNLESRDVAKRCHYLHIHREELIVRG